MSTSMERMPSPFERHEPTRPPEFEQETEGQDDPLERVEEGFRQRSLERAQSLETLEERRELFFRTFTTIKLLDSFADGLEDADFDDSEIEEVLSVFADMSNEDVWRSLSYPHELRTTLFARYRERIERGEVTPAAMVKRMQLLAREQGHGVGFHASQAEIRPSPDGSWVVRGTEQDHRDGDLTMAYYARSYRALYRRQGPSHLYFVRATDTDRTDGTWWRSPSLAVIQEVPMREVDAFVRDMEEHIHDGEAKENG